MKTLPLFTKTKIVASVISDEIIATFPFTKKVTQNDEIELFLGKYPREFYIIFDDSLKIKDDDMFCIYDEDDKPIWFTDDTQINVIYFRDERVAKFVVSVILKHYPELCVFDEDADCFKTGEEFIK